MRHRHIRAGYADSVEAVEDVLDRGSVAEWRRLAAKVRREPHGRAAAALASVLEHTPMYGTTTLWRGFLAAVRARTEATGPAPRPTTSGSDLEHLRE